MIHDFPYTNFHDLNADWIVERIGNVDHAVTESAASAEAAAASEQAAASSAEQAAASEQSAQNNADLIQSAADNLELLNARIENLVSAETGTKVTTVRSTNISPVDGVASTTFNLPEGYAILEALTKPHGTAVWHTGCGINELANVITLTLETTYDTDFMLIYSSTEAVPNAEVVDIRTGYNGTVYTSAGDAVRGQVNSLHSEINAISSMDIAPVTIGQMLNFGISEYYQRIQNSTGFNCVYFACEPNTKYRVNKSVITARFLVATTETTPTTNVPTTQIVRNDSAEYIDITTGTNDHYIVAMCYVASLDTNLSWDDIRNSVTVYIFGARDNYARTKINAIESDTETLNNLIYNVEPTIINNYFIDYNGNYSAHNDFCVTDPVYITKNHRLHVYARGYNQSVSIVSRVDKGKVKYIPKVICTDSTAKWFTYDISESGYYVICGNKDTALKIYYTDAAINNPKISVAMFQKFGVIGDSYASGTIFADNQASYTKYALSWGQEIARRNGTVCTNYSKGGLSTRTWLTDDRGLPLLLANAPENIYYLVLGINDYYLLGESYLGTLEDITSHASYTEYPDTFYGNYGKIIEQIQAHAPNAKLIMFTVASTETVPQEFSDAIIKIALHYGIPYISQGDDEYFQTREYTAMVGGHPTAVGYAGMSTVFEKLISDCIKDNYYYFWKYGAYSE